MKGVKTVFAVFKNRNEHIVMRYFPDEYKGTIDIIEKYQSSIKAAQRAEQIKHKCLKAKKVVRNRGRT